MIDFNSTLGARALERLNSEFTVWLTTVSPRGIPHPRPVWFIWTNEGFLIYSQPAARKVQHIAANPQVSVHFDGGPKGADVQVFIGTAEILPDAPPADQVAAYMQKYKQEVLDMGYTVGAFAGEYRTAIRVRPARLRSY